MKFYKKMEMNNKGGNGELIGFRQVIQMNLNYIQVIIFGRCVNFFFILIDVGNGDVNIQVIY